MAIGVYSDFKIIEDQFYAGMTEILEQQADFFNAGSNNSIRFVNVDRLGNFAEEMYFKEISSLISRRDITSTADATDLKLESDSKVGPKINRKLGPVANTLDSLKKIGSTREEFSFYIGQQSAKAKLVDWLNTALLAGKTAIIKGGTGVYADKTGESSTELSYNYMVDLISMFGDKAGDIQAFAMHSVPFFQLFKDGLANYKIDRVAGALIVTGVPAAMGRPLIVSDSNSLIDPTGGGTGPDVPSYFSLGLTEDAIVVEESEEDTMLGEWVTGKENIVFRVQGEHAYNVRVKGYSYTAGTVNPDDATLGATASWTKKSNDNKATAGTAVETV